MDNADIPSFGDVLASFRTRARLSQQQLAKHLGKNRRSIAAWEAGDYLPKTKGDVLELVHIFALNDEEATILLKAAGNDPSRFIWNIPFPRNPFFTGRDQELELLHIQLQQGTSAVVGQAQSISGLGGIGKTQIAVEYAYRYHEEYQHVLWARAESVETLTADFTDIAFLLDLPEKNAKEQAITTRAVTRWLQRQRGWLLILDNADTPNLLPTFLPPTIGGHILITSRANDLSKLNLGVGHSLVVETLPPAQAALLLLRRANRLTRESTFDQVPIQECTLALQIAQQELGGLPLAIDLAGAYLKATGTHLMSYLQIYQQHRAELLKERRNDAYPASVFTTWNLAFTRVEVSNPVAADLLRLCAFLAPEVIPEELLTQGITALGLPFSSIATDPLSLNAAIEILLTHSLLTRYPQDRVLGMHRLVQAVLRESLPTHKQQQWMQRAIQTVEAVYPAEPDLTNRSLLERLLPHALLCVTWIEHIPNTPPATVWLLNKTGYYLFNRMRYAEAEPLLQRALAIREQQLEATHLDLAQSQNNLAELYRTQSRYAEAEPLYQRALVIFEHQLGASHPNTAFGLNNLALLYYEQGKYAEAEPLYQRALAIFEQQLEATHPSIAQSQNNLAALYYAQGRYAEAEPVRSVHAKPWQHGGCVAG